MGMGIPNFILRNEVITQCVMTPWNLCAQQILLSFNRKFVQRTDCVIAKNPG